MIEKVTCVIPTYGRSEMIERAIQSVLDQTYSNIEIIVVDDNGLGSDQQLQTKQVLTPYLEKGLIQYYANEKNKGGSASRNVGLFHASGQYITFLDDDDEYHPQKFEKQVHLLQSLGKEYVAVYSNYHRIDPKGNSNQGHENVSGDVYFLALSRSIDVGSGSNLMVKTKRAKEIGGYQEQFKRNQDLEFMTRILKDHKLAHVDEDLLTVHQEVRKTSYSYEQLVEVDRFYLQAFQDEILKLPKSYQTKLYQRVALERFAYGIVKGHKLDAFINCIKNNVMPWTFMRYCWYLGYVYFTKQIKAFKI